MSVLRILRHRFAYLTTSNETVGVDIQKTYTPQDTPSTPQIASGVLTKTVGVCEERKQNNVNTPVQTVDSSQ